MTFPTSAEIKVKLGGLGAGALAIITLIFTYCGGWKGGICGPSCQALGVEPRNFENYRLRVRVLCC